MLYGYYVIYKAFFLPTYDLKNCLFWKYFGLFLILLHKISYTKFVDIEYEYN